MGENDTNGNNGRRASANGGAIIQAAGLTKFYGSHAGIQDLNLEVASGEIFGLLGPNGAGKTTTIRLLMGFLRATSGDAHILGKDCWSESLYVHREVGYVPGDVRLFPRMTGQQTLDFFNRLRPERPPIMLPELQEKLTLDLTKRVKEYSQGMRQKLAVMIAFMHRPRLLILDEPTLGLDPLMQQAFYELVASSRDTGATVFISSHILSEMERVCDRVAIVRSGHLAAVERMEDLLRRKVRRARFVLAASETSPETLGGYPVSYDAESGSYLAEIRGPVQPFLAELALLPVKDLEMGHASLEEIFLDYYRPQAPGTPTPSAGGAVE